MLEAVNSPPPPFPKTKKEVFVLFATIPSLELLSALIWWYPPSLLKPSVFPCCFGSARVSLCCALWFAPSLISCLFTTGSNALLPRNSESLPFCKVTVEAMSLVGTSQLSLPLVLRLLVEPDKFSSLRVGGVVKLTVWNQLLNFLWCLLALNSVLGLFGLAMGTRGTTGTRSGSSLFTDASSALGALLIWRLLLLCSVSSGPSSSFFSSPSPFLAPRNREGPVDARLNLGLSSGALLTLLEFLLVTLVLCSSSCLCPLLWAFEEEEDCCFTLESPTTRLHCSGDRRCSSVRLLLLFTVCICSPTAITFL